MFRFAPKTQSLPFSVSRRVTLIVLVASLSLLPFTASRADAQAQAAAAPASIEQERLARDLDAIFSSAFPAEGPGAAVLVERDGEILLRSGYGKANLEHAVAATPETVFRIGSVTKQFTAVALLMLVEEGKVDLDASILEYLPEYPETAQDVTVEQLLVHTSGIKSYTGMESWRPKMREDLNVEEMISVFKEEPADFAPGTQFAYNNSGYFLIGAIVEAVSGKSYADFVAERIFTPLGMKSSSYDNPGSIIAHRAAGYEGQTGGYRNTSYISMNHPYAAGSLLSTVDDLARWNRALQDGELLKAETLRSAWTEAELADGRSTRYGYGWALDDYEGHRLVRHGGAINGFLSHSAMVPEEKISVIVLSNWMGGRGPEVLASQALATVLGVPFDQRKSVQLEADTLSEYAGLYEIEGDPEQYRVVIREGSELFTQRKGGQKSVVHAASKDHFFYSDGLARLVFIRNEKGEVTGTRMYQGVGPAERAAKTEREIPSGRQEIAVDSALLEEYVGEYELRAGFTLTITREESQLFAQATGQPRFPLFAESPNKFFLRVVDAQVEFVPGGNGKVELAILYQGGQELPAVRID